MKVAALYVQPSGIYSTPALVPGVEVDPWDEGRDARTYDGPWPVVAHPPCARWCLLATFVESRHPTLKKGDDGGTFSAALSAVRQWGGVLEHPAYSHAWPAHNLPAPLGWGVWLSTFCGGAVAAVLQHHYGHRSPKAAWLYAHGVALPDLDRRPPPKSTGVVVGYYNTRPRRLEGGVERLTKAERNATPPTFARVLLETAASARRVVTVPAAQ